MHDPRDRRKQDIASHLVENLSDGLLVWQTVCEFLAASRKLSSHGYDFNRACDDIRALMGVWSIALPSWQVLERAISLWKRNRLAYWDALIVAACLEAGADALYSEDFGGHSEIDGLKIVNPFVSAR